MARKFASLSEKEILALAISLEEGDGRIYGDFADGLRESYPDTAMLFDEMRREESDHRNQLIENYLPLVRNMIGIEGTVRTEGNDEAARVYRAFGRECHLAVRCDGAASWADLSPGLVVSVYPRCAF